MEKNSFGYCCLKAEDVPQREAEDMAVVEKEAILKGIWSNFKSLELAHIESYSVVFPCNDTEL